MTLIYRLSSKFLPLVVILAVLVTGAVTAQAQNSMVLSVSPTLFEMTANPSQTWSSSVRVINANPYPITVYAELVNFEPSGEAGQGTLLPVLDNEAAGETLAEWITINQSEITIPPEQTTSVPFTITVPEGAPPGGHFAAILIGTQSPVSENGPAMVQTAQVVTSLVFLSVAGDIVEAGSIREFIADKSVYESPNTSFSIRFDNTGNVHLQPQGEIEVTNMWGQLRGTIPINNNSQFGNVLPDSVRTYNFQWTSDWTLADIGRHTAKVTLAYGDQVRQFTSDVTHFWIIPWRALGVILLIVAAFVTLIVFAIRLYVRRMLQLAGVTPELHKQPTKRAVSVTAPLKAGVLDLRNELGGSQRLSFSSIWRFALMYRVAFVLSAAIIVFIVLIIWFVALNLSSDYSYEVSYEQPDGSFVSIDTQNDAASTLPGDGISITVVNHSSRESSIASVRKQLKAAGYSVTEAFEPVQTTKERSVLVYHPDALESVKELQTELPTILLSSYVSDDPEQPALVLYVGDDLINE